VRARVNQRLFASNAITKEEEEEEEQEEKENSHINQSNPSSD